VTAGALGLYLLAGSATVIAAIVAARLAHSLGLPALLVFLGLGLALGESGIGVQFDNAELAEALGLGALVLILAEGGLTTNWEHARRAAPAALLLATVGVTVSIWIAAACTHWMLGLGWRQALLLGAVLAPTDAAAVFSVLRRLPLPPLLSGMLEGESGLNDPLAVLGVTLLSTHAGHGTPALLIAGQVAWQLVGGAAIGVAAGLLGTLFLRKVALPATGLYPVAVLALIVAGYGAASLARASGFLAVYVAAVLLGNARLPHGAATRGFAEGIGWLAQIGLFVMLGLLAAPSRLPAQVLPALAAGLILVLLARPAAVLASTLPFRLPLRQQAFLSWAGLRGAVPIVLTTIPLSADVPGAARLFDQVFVIVVAFTLLQGPTLPWVAKRLDVTAPAEPLEIIVDAAPLDDLHADLVQAQVPVGSKLQGVEIFELRLPAEAVIALIVRDRHSLVPGPTTVLRTGDRLLIVVPVAAREATERRLRAVSRAGKLAGWLGEHGGDQPGERRGPPLPATRAPRGRRRPSLSARRCRPR
jgi:potassium/hydrogen antiporter